jgi:hypothetical protein
MKTTYKTFTTLIPIFICALIPLGVRMYYYFGEGTLQKDLYFIIATSPRYFVFTSPPFIVVSVYTYWLIKRAKGSKEIATKMSCMLLPISLFSFYWFSKYILSPLALGFLPFINLLMLFPGWLIGIVANNAYKDTSTK